MAGATWEVWGYGYLTSLPGPPTPALIAMRYEVWKSGVMAYSSDTEPGWFSTPISANGETFLIQVTQGMGPETTQTIKVYWLYGNGCTVMQSVTALIT